MERDFDAAMFRQEEALLAVADGFSDAEMAERPTTMPWGTPRTTGQRLVDLRLDCLVAHRMRLFLQARQSRNGDLGPADCRVGVRAPRPAG